jgi:DNA-binding CsgD family transcriptional regulator/nucleoside-triphosphatase THEP1
MIIAGRAAEQAQLRGSLTNPAWIVLAGTPGIGKTALLKWLSTEARAAGVTTVEVRPIEIEASIAFSALSDVVSRTGTAIRAQLSEPHQTVLNDLIASCPVDDPGLVRAAFSALLETCRAAGPLLVILDDAHWIDQQSAETIAFAARRVIRDQSIVAAFRSNERSLLFDAFVAEQASVVTLDRLNDSDIASIINSVGPLPPSLRLGLAKFADGNPLRAREIGRAAKRGAEALFTADNVSVQSNPLVSAAQQFPVEQLEVLYVASQLLDPSVDVLNEIFSPERVRTALVASSDAGHSITKDRRVEFDHPLFGDAVALLLPADIRRGLHGRVAVEIEELVERGRHLSLSSASLDTPTRVEVFVASTHAASRGSITLALQLAFRATDGITLPDLAQPSFDASMYVNSQRWLANLEFRVDDPNAAERRLRAIAGLLPAGPNLVRVSLDLAALLSWSKKLSDGIGTYESLLAADDVDDASMAEAGMQLAMLQINAGTVDEAVASARRGAEAGARAGGQVDAESTTMDVMARFLAGHGFDYKTLQRAAEREDLENWLSVQCPPFSLGPFMYAWTEDGRAFDQFETRRRVFRARGSAAALLMGIPFEASMLCQRGMTPQARELVQLGVAVAEFDNELSHALSRLSEARLYAHIGEFEVAEQSLVAAENSFSQLEFRLGSIEAANIRMSIYAAKQDRIALVRLGEQWVTRLSECGLHELAVIPGLLDLIEAASGPARNAVADASVSLMEQLTVRLQTAENTDRLDLRVASLWAEGHRHAGAGAHEEARKLFSLASDGFTSMGRTFWVARTDLARGRIERRAGARRLATELFRSALDGFVQCEAAAWCDVVRNEDKRLSSQQTSDSLSTIEAEVARLASLGESNKEIATKLFISAKTVESHLGNVYRKLGINRRTQIHAALAGD